MRNSLSLLLVLLLLTACGGETFSEDRFPAAQTQAELAAKRVLNHGTLEPVLEIGQPLDQWQFKVGSIVRSSLTGDAPAIVSLSDRSGVKYTVDTSTPEAIRKTLRSGDFGFATGRVEDVLHEPDPRSVSVTLQLTDWEPRK